MHNPHPTDSTIAFRGSERGGEKNSIGNLLYIFWEDLPQECNPAHIYLLCILANVPA